MEQHERVRQVALAEHPPADFASTFRQRFAALFGRKIARQRSEQYLGALLAGGAERRDVTSLARKTDGASARALGWLLNKSPWATRPVVEALQAYVGETLGDAEGVFALSLDSFVKRGDNAVGAAKQYVAYLDRALNCQIGVFLTYGSAWGSALVDAELYLPRSWTESPPRREKAGVPGSVQYQPRSALAVALLEQARATGALPGRWVTSWHGEGFEPDLRDRLDAAGWWYLLPASAAWTAFASPDEPTPRALMTLAADAGRAPLLRRVWDAADGTPGRPLWLLAWPNDPAGSVDGAPALYLSNAPEDLTVATLERVVAARARIVQMLAASSERVSLDVYRVRGWDGWHRHVTLALLASALRAGLAAGRRSAARALAEAHPEPPAPPVAAEAPASDLTDGLTDGLAAAVAEAPARDLAAAPALPVMPQDTPEPPLLTPLDAPQPATAPPDAIPAAPTPTVYHLQVELDDSDWRAVRAFQVLLVAEEAGEVLFSMPSRADINRQGVGAWMEVRVRSSRSIDELRAALSEVPEITVVQLTAVEAPADVPAAVPAASLDAAAGADEDALSEEGQAALLAALQAELAARTTAREAGLSALELAAESVAATIHDAAAQRPAEPVSEPVGAGAPAGGTAHADATGIPHAHADGSRNGTANGASGGADLANARPGAPLARPNAPPAEGPARLVPAAPAGQDGAARAGAAASMPSPTGAAPAAPVPTTPEAAAPVAEQQMVILDVGEESYGLPVQRVREIVRVPPITRVPNGPAFLEGVINLRGQVLPVLDLRRHLGVPSGALTRRSRVVISELGRHTVGLIVDGVSQVVMVATDDVEPPPTLVAGVNDGQVRGVARLGDRLVLFLDPDRLLPER